MPAGEAHPADAIARLLLASALLAACTSTPNAADPDRVSVEYVHPETFTDVGSRYLRADSEREVRLAALRSHLVQRASALLAPGHVLAVAITDVDMAGSFEPIRAASGYARVIRSVYPARIDLRFRLTATDGSVVHEGQRTLRDSILPAAAGGYRDDPLRYEKALLDRWLERELGAPGA